jgi:hypothetical protein
MPEQLWVTDWEEIDGFKVRAGYFPTHYGLRWEIAQYDYLSNELAPIRSGGAFYVSEGSEVNNRTVFATHDEAVAGAKRAAVLWAKGETWS